MKRRRTGFLTQGRNFFIFSGTTNRGLLVFALQKHGVGALKTRSRTGDFRDSSARAHCCETLVPTSELVNGTSVPYEGMQKLH